MNNPQGWVSLHRKLLGNPIAGKPEYLSLWVHLLLMANHEESNFIWNSQKQTLKPGQLLTGRKKLSQATGIKSSQIYKILKYLEKEQQIEQQTTTKYTIITIKNWGEYQGMNNKSNNRVTTERQQSNTYNNVNNVNNVNKDTHPLKEDIEKGFVLFWSKYPKKVGKKQAEKSFIKMVKDLETLKEVMNGLSKALKEWSGKDKQYIPHASTWLNGERWNDEYTATEVVRPRLT